MTAPAIPDARQRELALDPARSFIVQAPAGSGKTELLIQRYLVLLARVDEPESVLAITFTRKAAGEMRGRVLKALRDAAATPRPEAAHEARTWDLARAVQTHGEARGWDLFLNPARLRIRTIDSLCSSIAAQMPWLSRFGAAPQMAEDPSDLYLEAARRTIELLEAEDWTEPLERLLLHLDNDYQRLRGLLAEMLKRRDQWLRHVASVPPPDAHRAALEAALGRVIEDGVAAARLAVPPEFAGEIADVSGRAGANVESACAGIDALPPGDDLPAWLAIADVLLTGKGDWRKRLTVSDGFPPDDKALKKRGTALLEDLADHDVFRFALAALRNLPAPRFEDAHWQALEALVRLLPVAVAQLQVEFASAGRADFTQAVIAAQHALGDSAGPSEIALRMDYRIQHLLVDEFQDTSVSHLSLLVRLTSGWEPGDGRTLFAVGDPMQSIYRFREAMVGLFLQACHDGVGDVPLEPIRLSANFRSDCGVVEFVNRTFPAVLPATEDAITGAIPFHPSHAIRGAGLPEAVHIHPFLDRDDDAEAAAVVDLVRASRERGARTTAILARSRSHLTAILPALRAAGLPFRAVKIAPLAGTPIVRDLTALTRALLHPADRIAWLAVLRAPWCGLSLAALHALTAADANATIWDLVCDQARERSLESGDRTRLVRLRDALAPAVAQSAGPLRQRVEGAWLAVGGPACAGGATALDDAEEYLDLVESLDRGGTLDLAELERRMDDLYSSPDVSAGDQLQVMTIHNAKGLEFDTVILPGLGRKPRRDDSRLMLWQERPRPHADPDLVLAPLPSARSKEERTYAYLKKLEATKGRFEAGRLLYVAATRARQELHLLGHTTVGETKGVRKLREPETSSLLRSMWQAAEPEFARAFAAAPEPVPADPNAAPPARTPVAIERFTLSWSRPEPSAAVAAAAEFAAGTFVPPVSFHWVGDVLRHSGTVVHQMMRRIAEDGITRWDRARLAAMRPAFESALASLGVPVAELNGAGRRVAEALAAAVEDDRGRSILSAPDAACEFPLTGVIDGNTVAIRVDRTFVDDAGTRWIVDYKTSSHEGAGLEGFLDNERERYRDQLARYRRLFAQWESRPIRAGLYFPLLQAWREVEFGEVAAER